MIRRGSRPRPSLVVGTSVAVLLGLAASGCGSSSSAESDGDMATIKYAQIGTSATSWPLYIGEETGIFEKNHIDFEPIVTKQPSQAISALIAGSADFANSGTPDIIASVDKGSSLKIVSSLGAAAPFSILGSKNVKTWSDLKGKPVIGDETHGVSTYYFDKAAEKNGLSLDDLKFTYAGSTADRYAALVSGAVDASIISPPTMFSALSKGYTDLGPINDILGPTPFNVIAVDEKWASAHKTEATNFMKAYVEACEWLNDPANREEAQKILEEKAKATPDQAKKTYDYFEKINMFPNDPSVTAETLDPLLKDFVKYGTLTEEPKAASEYLDDGILQAAAAK